MHRFAWLLSLVVLLLGGAAARSQSDDTAQCRAGAGDPAIIACTHLIVSGKYKDRALAGIYSLRAAA